MAPRLDGKRAAKSGGVISCVAVGVSVQPWRASTRSMRARQRGASTDQSMARALVVERRRVGQDEVALVGGASAHT